MKLRMASTLVLVVMAFVAVSAVAQTQTFTANIPFQFQLGDRSMPAGNYTVWSVSDRAIAMRSVDREVTRVSTVHSVERIGPGIEAKLVFDHIGDQYFLSQVWGNNTGLGRELPAPKLQQEMARKSLPETKAIVMASK